MTLALSTLPVARSARPRTPQLKPRSLVSYQARNALTALDVSICSPHAQEAGLDCTQTMVDSRLAHDAHHLRTHRLERLRQTPLKHVDRLAHSQQVHFAQA